MSGGFQYVKFTDFFPYTPVATSQAVGYEATRLAAWNHTRPLIRTWRSTTLDPQSISFAFGGSKTGTWVALLNANFTQVQIGIGTGGPYTDVVTGGALVTRTIPQDATDPEGYYKLFLPCNYTGTIGAIGIPSQSTTDGAAYYKLGLAAWGSSIVTMTYNLQVPVTYEYVDPEYRVEGKDWSESARAGISYANITTRNLFPWNQALEWHALRVATKPGQRVFAFWNLDNLSEIEIWERQRNMTLTRQGITQEVESGFRTLS